MKPITKTERAAIADGTILELLQGCKDLYIQSIFQYGKVHNLSCSLFVDQFYIDWWGVPAERHHEHTYIQVSIVGGPDNSYIRYCPWSGRGKASAGGGYTEDKTFAIFLQLGNEFKWEHTQRTVFTSLSEAVMAYNQIASKGAEVKLLFNAKKGFLIGNSGGVPIFTSYAKLCEFFFQGEDPDECEALNTLLAMKEEELVGLIRSLPGGKSFRA